FRRTFLVLTGLSVVLVAAPAHAQTRGPAPFFGNWGGLGLTPGPPPPGAPPAASAGGVSRHMGEPWSDPRSAAARRTRNRAAVRSARQEARRVRDTVGAGP